MSKQPLIPPFGDKVHLKQYDPSYSGKYIHENEVQPEIEADLTRLRALQDMLYAESKRSVLIILQGIDAGGKDGTVSHVFRGLNPQGVHVVSFKQPSHLELAHDFLWRIHHEVPAKGYIGVFNRSHYEDVLVVRVHNMIAKHAWKARYEQINRFEEMLTGNGTTILKFFLYISKDEQKRRFEARLRDRDKQWKFAMGDLDERQLWDDYIDAFEAMLTNCNTEYAPWHIVPANHKWYRNLVVTRSIVQAMEDMGLAYPAPIAGLDKIVIPD